MCRFPPIRRDGVATASTRQRRSPIRSAAQLSLPVRDVLRRANAPAQVGLERGARLRNAVGSARLRAGAAAPPQRGARRRRIYDGGDPRCLRPGAARLGYQEGRRRDLRPGSREAIENAARVRSITGLRSIEAGQGGVRCRSRSELATLLLPTRSSGTSKSVSRRWPNRFPTSPGWRSSCGWRENPAIADGKVAEANLYLKGITLRAQEGSADLTHSVDLVADKLARQVKRHRDKRRRRREQIAGKAARAASL